MIIYIAGAISTDPNYKAKFSGAHTVLAHLGHTVLDPTMLPTSLSYDALMNIDMAMLNEADAICLFDDWKQSEGAKKEKEFAGKHKKKILFYDKFINNEIWRGGLEEYAEHQI